LFKFEQSKIRLKNIIQLNPNFEKAHYNLGLIYLNEGKDFFLAKKCFETAIQLNPDYKLAWDNLKYITNNE